MRSPPAHRATTAHLQSAYPFVSAGGLDGQGPLVGRDLFGGLVRFDPWDLYRRGVVTNPNILVLGQVGRGKSTFVKTLAWRQLAHGRRVWIIDPKGEYGPLARAAGRPSIRLSPGGPTRLNPLDVPMAAGQADLVSTLVASSLGRAVAPAERTALDLALRAADGAGATTLADVVTALFEPDPELAASVRTDAAGLARDGRLVALELRRLVDGDLAGLFDGPTSSHVGLEAPLVCLDLSAVFASAALPLLMTCAAGWLQSILARADGAKRLLVIDEAWAVLHDLATARWLQATFKLSRSLGVCNIAVVHRLSDLQSAGAEGSAQQRLAEGLLADAETRVIFGQPPAEAETTSRMLGLTATERDLLTRLPRGVALWKVGDRSLLVEHVVGGMEAELVDTDAAMIDSPPPGEPATP